MISTLLGLGDIIANAFKTLIYAIIKPIVTLVMDFVIAPIITLLIEIIFRTISGVLYVISCFILQLIDFVELLFRSLAGLESASSTGMSMELSLDGGTGDILIQLIRHPDIQSAFVSMCIVGLFLLVVTTVFQIIKVEYTTEGAKNAKGPILQKAFRGLSNLMLLPLLVVFGIVFANQLLGLLDTATKGDGENPTISGLIFVTAAGNAHYRKDGFFKQIDTGLDTVNIILVSIESAIDACIDNFGKDTEVKSETEYVNNEAKREIIEDGFISQSKGYLYYDISDVSEYYDFGSINYLLLLFGGVFVLKSLFFASFGMVIRLYKCAMLFIISPAIIGMTPINEGGLGSWRKSFIGQVLAGYGTILSLNLFFIIVRVLLSIEVKFKQSAFGITTGFLTSSFMTFLLKAIFVLAGCLLIEQFSKEIGGYFGADDAMGAGKQMAGQVGDMAMKGVQAAALVGTGGAALAMKGAKMAGGIANKVKTFRSGAKDGGGIKGGFGALKTASQEKKQAKAQAKADSKNITGLSEQKDAVEAKKAKLDIELAKGAKKYAAEKKFNHSKDQHFIKKYEATLKEKEELESESQSIDTRIDRAEEFKTAKEDKQTARRNKVLNAVGAVYGLGQQAKGNLPGSKYFKQFSDAAGSGTKALGGAFETAHNDLEYVKGQKLQKEAAKLPVVSGMIAANTTIAASRISIQAAKETQATMDKIKVTAEDILEKFMEYTKTLGKGGRETESYRNLEVQKLDQINANGGNMTLSDLRAKVNAAESAHFTPESIKAASQVDLNADLKIKFNPKEIEKAVKDAIEKGAKNPDDIKDALKDVFTKMGKDGEATLMKIVNAAFEKYLTTLDK